MSRVIPRIVVAAVVASVVAGCGLRMFEQREPWRTQAEVACLSEGLVKPSDHVRPVSEIDGEGACGMTRPFKVSAFADGFIAVKPQATLACPIIPQLQAWVSESIQPAAMRWFGQPVVEIRQMSSYSCRGQNGQAGAKISEHAFGNALDIGSFRLADERVISVRDHWSRGTPEEKGFLREVAGAACKRFTTVLGPGSNIFHYDHIHVDLARRKSRDICKPGVLPTGPSPADLIVRKNLDLNKNPDINKSADLSRSPVLGGSAAAGRPDAMPTGAIRQSALPSLRPIDPQSIDESMPGGRMPTAIPGSD